MFGMKSTPSPSYAADAVVTGAGSGIGRAFALELSRRGGRVVCADISLERAEETVRLLPGRGYAVACDVAVRSQVEDLALFEPSRVSCRFYACNISGWSADS